MRTSPRLLHHVQRSHTSSLDGALVPPAAQAASNGSLWPHNSESRAVIGGVFTSTVALYPTIRADYFTLTERMHLAKNSLSTAVPANNWPLGLWKETYFAKYALPNWRKITSSLILMHFGEKGASLAAAVWK